MLEPYEKYRQSDISRSEVGLLLVAFIVVVFVASMISAVIYPIEWLCRRPAVQTLGRIVSKAIGSIAGLLRHGAPSPLSGGPHHR